MKTGLTMVKEIEGIRFYGEVSAADVMRLKLDSMGRMLMNDSVGIQHAADHLLVLEMLFRRIAEQK